MKPNNLFLMLVLTLLGAAGGWYAGRQHSTKMAEASPAGPARVYSCSMHPQVRSDKPGTCPFCGMALAPLGEAAPTEGMEGTIMLSSNRLNVIHVQTAEIRRQPLRRTLRVAGTIEDNDSRRRVLSAYVDGRIDRLFVNYIGAEVTEGQPLATLYSPGLLAAAKEYVALNRETPSDPMPAVNAEHRRLLDGAASRLRQMGLAEAQIASLPGRPAGDLHLDILAPMSGTVVTRSVYEGQYVKEGDKLFELADFSVMWFRFDAYERDLPWLKAGQAVEVTPPSLPGKVYAASITFIDPNVNDPTRSAKVRVEIANPIVESSGLKRRELFHRVYAEATVKVEVPDALALPRSAVLSPGQTAFVYVDKGHGNFERRRVHLGRVGDELCEVLDGLSAGERVVTEGNLLIDAQAQLDTGGSFLSSDAATTPAADATNALPPFTEAQQQAAAALLAVTDTLAAALAADNLADFNAALPRLQAGTSPFQSAFAQAPAWEPLAKAIAQAVAPAPAKDLAGARKSFWPLSTAMVDFVRAARRAGMLKDVKVFKCPMADQAFPGAPETALWIQLKAPLRNPWFGAEMLECGVEVKP